MSRAAHFKEAETEHGDSTAQPQGAQGRTGRRGHHQEAGASGQGRQGSATAGLDTQGQRKRIQSNSPKKASRGSAA